MADPPSQPTADLRRAPRYELLAQVRAQHDTEDEDYVLQLTNISRLGALVFGGTLDPPAWLAEGAQVQLAIVHPMDLATVEVLGRVARITRQGERWGFGVEFSGSGDRAAAGLQSLIDLGRLQPPPLPAPSARPPADGPDRRRHPRYELLAQVCTSLSDENLVLELSDISLSGVMVLLGSLERPDWLEVGRAIDLAIIDPVELDPVMIRGTVARVDKLHRRWGFAVQLDALDEAAEAGMRRLIKLGRPQPPPLPKATQQQAAGPASGGC